MRVLRIVLLLASAAGLVFVCYQLSTRPGLRSPEPQIAVGVAIMFALNILYLLACPPGTRSSTSRLGKLLDLWLEAKESELRERAKPKGIE